jgi:hypothetical protein
VTPENEPPATSPEGNPPRPEPPVSESSPLREPSAAAAAADSAQPASADDVAAAAAAEEPPRRAGFSGGALIGAAVLGAAIALAVGAAATVFFLPRDEGAPVLAARLAALELQVRDLPQPAASASAPAPNTRALDDVASRVAKLEAAGTGALPASGAADGTLSNRLAGLEGEVKALADTIGALGRRSDDATAAARDARTKSDTAAASIAALAQKVGTGNPLTKSDLDNFDQRVAALERSHKLLEAELAKRSAAAASGDRALRLSFAASALKAAVERGEPFAPELATVKALGADPAALAPLEPFAVSGVPSAGTLALKLAELAPSLRAPAAAAPAPAPGENFLQRLQVNAEKLVRMRPVGEAEGDAVSGGVARAAAMAARDDLAGALAELAKLPPAERAPADSWIKQAQARAAAIDASRRLAADALAGLGK